MSASNNEQSNSRLSFISNNAVTCYKNTWVTSENNIMTYCTRTLGELLIAITDNKREHVDKENREQIYITYDGTRPHVDEYQKWNGLQVFDLDLKEYTGNIDYLKIKLFEILQEYHWFLWICKSSSGKGLHIYTKVTPAHHVYVKIKDNELISKYWYKINFIHKSGLIYAILYDLHNDPNIPITFNELEDDFDVKDFDKVVQRITTGIRLTYDKDILVNSDFLDLHVSVGLTQTKFGWLNKDEITRIWFRQTDFNTKLQFEIFELVDALANNKNEVEKEEKSKKTITTLNVDFDELKALPRTNLYGKDGLNLAHTILDSKGCDNIREINGMYACALSNKKETSKIGLDILRKADIRKIDYGVNVVTTFDKFAKSSYDKITTAQAVKKITELFFISVNDPFAAKLCLLTGTETGETYFFGQVANVIKIRKKSLEKSMEFHICDDMTDCITRLANKVAALIIEGYRIIIPTNKGDIYSEKLIGMITYLIGRKPKYAYYKRSNNEQEICDIINDTNSIGDYEIVFCSNYLSVGVDILDRYKFASIYFGPFSGYEIEQFNARIRKTGIRSLYCIATENANGYINEDLLEEPNMVLRLTSDDINNFKDDKEIASAKQEFIAQYDPMNGHIVILI
ncbi:MAG: hypothetical protein EZS28_007220 [Streblomastix strix]|uniref:Uncharacterized protein n=1 Tax=Streblomastix strix TaxID=222440 RepID=A0A5J4WR45_9EUKA|nr:MAG: hypothetical protein EZS28_007217 [Streblomastix strix]KAA6397256.1 MAG: hypothetical protein EZS28_007220 [Streblomastix strix]